MEEGGEEMLDGEKGLYTYGLFVSRGKMSVALPSN